MSAVRGSRGRRGFTLLEVVVAIGLFAGGCLALAQLLAVAARAARLSHATTTAGAAAADRLERLRSMAWGVGADGAPVDEVGLSPPGTLTDDTPGFVDYLDDDGAVVGAWPSPPFEAMFVRRWAVTDASGEGLPDTLRLQVVVLRRVNGPTAGADGSSSWTETVRVVGARARRPS